MEIITITTFITYFESVRKRTLKLAAVIPPEHIEWSPAQEKFTIGDQLRHIALTERYMFAENIQGKQSCYLGCGIQYARELPEILALMDTLHRESLEIFSSLTDEQLQRRVLTPAGTPISAWKWLRAMIEHEIHHRAQIYSSLSLLNIGTPPIFGLTSEEVVERSVTNSKFPAMP